MYSMSFDELIRQARIGPPEEIRDSVGDVQYLAFHPEGGPVIFVEATVPNFVESLTQLNIRQQTAVIATVAKRLPHHGDSIVIHRGEGGKNRGARIVRVKDVAEQPNEIYLLITR